MYDKNSNFSTTQLQIEMDQIRRSVGTTMRLVREARNLTQYQLANLLQISQGYLSKLENGHIEPSMTLWFSFCKITKIPLDSTSFESLAELQPTIQVDSVNEVVS